MGIVASVGLVVALTSGTVAGPSYPPFDLTHLPAVGPQGLLGFRPAALAGGATTWGPFGDPRLLASALGGALEVNASAAEGPAPAEVAECVFGISINASVTRIPRNEKGHQRSIYIGFPSTSGFVRTTQPFDWAGRLRKWFPNGVPGAHAGREYLVVPMRFEGKTAGMAFYCPDARTVVFGHEDKIHATIDRPAAGPTPPAGWDVVARSAVALAVVADDRPWLTVGPDVKTSPPLEDARDLSKSFERLSVEVPTLARVRLTFAAKNAAAAGVAEACLNRLLGRLREVLAEELPNRLPPFAFTVTGDGTTVRVETPSVPGLVRLMMPKDEQ